MTLCMRFLYEFQLRAFDMPEGQYVIVDVPGCGTRAFILEDYLRSLSL